jgi:hypothetical protein
LDGLYRRHGLLRRMQSLGSARFSGKWIDPSHNPIFIRLALIAGSADTGFAQPPKVRMTRRQAQALEVIRLAIDAARKTGLTDQQIFDAINLQIHTKRTSFGLEPK